MVSSSNRPCTTWCTPRPSPPLWHTRGSGSCCCSTAPRRPIHPRTGSGSCFLAGSGFVGKRPRCRWPTTRRTVSSIQQSGWLLSRLPSGASFLMVAASTPRDRFLVKASAWIMFMQVVVGLLGGRPPHLCDRRRTQRVAPRQQHSHRSAVRPALVCRPRNPWRARTLVQLVDQLRRAPHRARQLIAPATPRWGARADRCVPTSVELGSGVQGRSIGRARSSSASPAALCGRSSGSLGEAARRISALKPTGSSNLTVVLDLRRLLGRVRHDRCDLRVLAKQRTTRQQPVQEDTRSRRCPRDGRQGGPNAPSGEMKPGVPITARAVDLKSSSAATLEIGADQTEVDNLGVVEFPPVVAQQDVRRLHVTVDQTPSSCASASESQTCAATWRARSGSSVRTPRTSVLKGPFRAEAPSRSRTCRLRRPRSRRVGSCGVRPSSRSLELPARIAPPLRCLPFSPLSA